MGFCRPNAWAMPEHYNHIAAGIADKMFFFSRVVDSKDFVWSEFSVQLIGLFDEAVENHVYAQFGRHKDLLRVVTDAEALQLRSVVMSGEYGCVWEKLFGVSKRLCLVGSLFLPGMGHCRNWRCADIVLARLSFGLTCADVEDLKRRFEGAYCAVEAFFEFILKSYIVCDGFALRRFQFVTCQAAQPVTGCIPCQLLRVQMNAIGEQWFGFAAGEDIYGGVSELDSVKLLVCVSRL